MSSGDKTKCDLDADKAKIDIKALNEQLHLRFRSLALIHDETEEMCFNTDIENKVFEALCHGSRTLDMLVEQLAITAELSNTVQESGSRTIVPVNLLTD